MTPRQRWDRLLPILLFVVLAAHVFPPQDRMVSYRMKHMLEAGWRIARGAGVSQVMTSDFPGYDSGTPLLLGFLLRATRTQDELAAGRPDDAPRWYYVLGTCLNAVLLVVLYLALRELLNRAVALAMCLVYLLAPSLRFVAFSGDVYLFPVYAGILLLAALALMPRRGRAAAALLGACVVGIAGCNLFRSGAALVAFGFLVLVIRPTWLVEPIDARRVRLRGAACLVGAVLLVALPSRAMGLSNHVFWHALHCGLAEFGGHEDAKHNVYPFFVPHNDLPPDARPVDQWSDQRTFQFAASIEPGVRVCSGEYEAIMRDAFLRTAATYPGGMVRLVARRLWRVSCLNPWQHHEADSRLLAHGTDGVWSVGWIVLCSAGIWVGMSRRALLLCAGLLPLVLPTLLVHSGYMMYNLSARFPLYLLGLCAAGALIQRLAGRRRPEDEPRASARAAVRRRQTAPRPRPWALDPADEPRARLSARFTQVTATRLPITPALSRQSVGPRMQNPYRTLHPARFLRAMIATNHRPDATSARSGTPAPEGEPAAGEGARRADFPGGRAGPWLAVALGVAFVATHLGNLPVNLQMDGQLPEYLAWVAAPDASGESLNPGLNKRLYSFYYVGLGRLAAGMGRLNVLRLVYAVEIVALCAAVYCFVVVLTRDRWAALLAVAAAVWHGATSVALGGSGGVGLICGPLYPATAMALIALALSWQRRHVAAALMAGLAFNLHGSSALFVAAMVLLAAAVDAGWRRLAVRILPTALACLCAAAPTVVWILLNPPPAATMSTVDWLRFPKWIYPLHMIVSATPPRAWTMLFVFVLPGILGLAARRRVLQTHMPTLQGWIAAAGALLVIGYVFVEWIPLRPIAQLSLWRGTRYLVLLCLAFGLSHLVRCIRNGGFAAGAAALTLVAFVTPAYPQLAWIGHLGLIGLLAVTARRVHGFDRLLTAAAMLAVCAVVLYEASLLGQLGEYLRWRWPVAAMGLSALFVWSSRSQRWYRQVAALSAMVVVALWLARLGVTSSFPRAYRRRAAALLDLAPTIEQVCPPGRIVIAPPDLRNPGAWANRGSFLCRQQLTAYAYAPWLAEAILERVQWYLDMPVDRLPTDEAILPRLSEGYRRRTSDAFVRLRDDFGVRLAIVEHGRPLAFHPVAENDVFTVYDLDDPRP